MIIDDCKRGEKNPFFVITFQYLNDCSNQIISRNVNKIVNCGIIN